MSDSEQLVETGGDTDDLDLFSKQLFGVREVKAAEPSNEPTSDEDSEEEVDDDTVAEDDDSTKTEADTDDASDEDDEPVEPKGKKNRKSFQERINELTAKNKETERLAAVERAEMARRFNELEAKLNPPKETAKAAPAGAPDPNADGEDGEALYPLGEFDPKYIRDLTRFTIAQEQEAAEKFRAQKDQEAQENQLRAQVAEHWKSNLLETEKELPDIREKINDLEVMFTGLDTGYAQYLVDLVMTLENGPRILHYLGDNPKEAQEIVSSGAAAATVKLGKLDGRMARVPIVEAPVKKVSKAPEPPKSTRGTGGKFSTAGDTDDLDAFSKTFFRSK